VRRREAARTTLSEGWDEGKKRASVKALDWRDGKVKAAEPFLAFAGCPWLVSISGHLLQRPSLLHSL